MNGYAELTNAASFGSDFSLFILKCYLIDLGFHCAANQRFYVLLCGTKEFVCLSLNASDFCIRYLS